MKCEFCGEENSTNAIFCKKCGHRLDGEETCPNCGKLTPADGEYCIFCGYNLKENQSNDIADSNLKVASQPTLSASKDNNEINRSQVLNLISFISSCIVILCSFIFTFLIGVDPKITGDATSITFASTSYNIYYYFFEAYNQILDSEIIAYGLMGPLLGTIAVSITIIGVLITIAFSIKAIVAYVNKSSVSITKYAVITYFVFLGGVILFLMNISASVSSIGTSLYLQLNTPAICGIIIGGIFLLISAILDSINHGIVGNLRNYLSQGILSCFATVLSILALSLLGKEIFAFSVGMNHVGLGISTYSTILFESTAFYYPLSDADWMEFVGNYIGVTIICIAIFVLAITFIVSLIFMLKSTLTNFGSNFKGAASIHGIISGICLLIIGILKIILGLVFTPFFVKEEISANLMAPIVLILLGILLLIISIMSKVIFKKKKVEQI